MSQQDYEDGMADGLADRDPDPKRLALGADRLNDYERGYVDSGDPFRGMSDSGDGAYADPGRAGGEERS